MKTIEDILRLYFDGDEVEKIISTEFSAGEDVASAWYMKALIGASGWIASLTFLVAAGIFFDTLKKGGGLALGLALCAAAALVNHRFRDSVFARQFALSIGLAGLAMATFFFYDLTESTVMTCLFSLAVNGAMAAFYAYSPMRFLSVQAMVVSLVVLMEKMKITAGVSLLVILLAMIVFVLWVYESDFAAGPFAPLARACSYALTFSLIALPVLSLKPFHGNMAAPGLIATAGVAVLFAVAQARIFSSMGIGVAGLPFILSLLLTAAFAAITRTSPGIIAALYVTALGFYRGNRIVTAGALLGLGAYIVAFYYNLSLTLLVKSYILMGSGAVFIVSWAVLRKFRGDAQ